MLLLNDLLSQNTPHKIEQGIVSQYLAFANQSGFSVQTAEQNLVWILKLMRFHNGRHPADLNGYDIASYLSVLATEESISEIAQASALSAIKDFYRSFLRVELVIENYKRPKKRRGFADRFPTKTCINIIEQLKGPSQLMAKLAFHCQLKLPQVARLKLSDIDLKTGKLSVIDKDNSFKFSVNIPLNLHLDLRIQMMRANQINKSLYKLKKAHARSTHPAQIGLFRQQSNLLFVLSDINQANKADSTLDISPESQLAILKSEIQLVVNRLARAGAEIIPPKLNQKHSNKSKRILFERSRPHNSLPKLLSNRVNYANNHSNPQPDFFASGVA